MSSRAPGRSRSRSPPRLPAEPPRGAGRGGAAVLPAWITAGEGTAPGTRPAPPPERRPYDVPPPRAGPRREERAAYSPPPPSDAVFGGPSGGRGGGRGSGRGRGRRGDRGGGAEDEADMKWGRPGEEGPAGDAPPLKEPEPDYGLSGALAAETNTVDGVVLVHTEPPEARAPTARWRLYAFKAGEPLGEPLRLGRASRLLFGRERRVADVPTDHPSCSKQHAVLQFRLTAKPGPDGMPAEAVRPYVMDLGSTNGTHLNGERLEAARYYELLEKDVLKFGNSSREFVLIREA
jgi:hypothetical protein